MLAWWLGGASSFPYVPPEPGGGAGGYMPPSKAPAREARAYWERRLRLLADDEELAILIPILMTAILENDYPWPDQS
jgi:hypothetical protein